jgi:hypothetical protein
MLQSGTIGTHTMTAVLGQYRRSSRIAAKFAFRASRALWRSLTSPNNNVWSNTDDETTDM